VPQENIFAEGNGDLIIAKDFTWSGPVAAIAAVELSNMSSNGRKQLLRQRQTDHA
jgi:hypothetical protein